MKRIRKHNFLSIFIFFALLLTSCGGADTDADAIATAVAMTVSAKETEAAKVTNTSAPTEAEPTFTPEATKATTTAVVAPTFAPPTAPGPVGSGDPCLLANLISETVPDGTIMQPGQTFWKSWHLKNGGTCTWNSAYKIVFWSGELMDGQLEYPFPDVVSPGEETDISLLLRAPSSNGNYSSYWKIQSEWGGQFGVGQYDQPFWVTVNVNNSSNPSYTVTNVSYNIVREPAAGCATNVFYTVYATITTNGPTNVTYQWLQSDGNNSGIGANQKLKFTQAESITVSREWSFHLGATPGTKWMQIVIHAPDYQEYPRATWTYACGN